jgi:DNA-binding response OmpR family regulator
MRVIIVDDEENIGLSLKLILEREGYPAYRGKTNLGLGHASAMQNSPNAEVRK